MKLAFQPKTKLRELQDATLVDIPLMLVILIGRWVRNSVEGWMGVSTEEIFSTVYKSIFSFLIMQVFSGKIYRIDRTTTPTPVCI